MSTKDLQALSKTELIQIIENLSAKYCIDGETLPTQAINYKTLLEATTDVIFYLDKAGNMQYINSAWKTYYPSMDRNILGRHYAKSIPAIEKERATYVFEDVIANGTVFQNELMKTFDEKGEAIYFNSSFSPVRDDENKIIGLIGIMKNVTTQHLMGKRLRANAKVLEEKIREQVKQAEELKTLKDLNEEIINNAPIGIIMMDLSGVVLMENPTQKQIMGRSPDETIVGVNLLDYEGFVQSEFGRLFKRCLAEKKTTRGANILYNSISGQRDLIINLTLDPIVNKRGSVEKVLIMVEDNTEQARNAKRAQKAEQLSALGFLASGVAQELRGHINKMVMDLNFVENNIEKGNPAAEYVESMHDELVRIKNIAEQLVSLASADDESRERCEINKIIQNHPVDVILNRLTKDGYSVKLELSDKNPAIMATQNQIQQLLLQFIENAEEAMPEKGTLRIVTDVVEMESGSYASIEVEDSGIGISEENIKRIFQPFFTTKGKKATGLGLMITAAIVENLGGHVGIRSAPGEGTSIRVIIPVANN